MPVSLQVRPAAQIRQAVPPPKHRGVQSALLPSWAVQAPVASQYLPLSAHSASLVQVVGQVVKVPLQRKSPQVELGAAPCDLAAQAPVPLH